MNYQGCKRKFDVAAFVAKYGAKVYGEAAGTSSGNEKKTKKKK